METKQILKNLDTVFRYVLVAILLLSFLIFIFVFTINWEAYFFGVKLNGAPAGMYLLLQGMIAGSLAFLLIKYRRYTLAVAVLAVIYFGYTFVDSAVTIQTLTDNLYSPLLLVLFIISLLFLIIHILSARFGNGGHDTLISESTRESMNESKIETTSFTTETKKSDDHTVKQIVILMVAAFAIVFLFLLVMPLFSMFFSGTHAVASPSVPDYTGDTLLTKINEGGATEWQALVNGRSVMNLYACPSEDGGCGVIAGMFEYAGQTEPSLRVMKLDRYGRPVWDIRRDTSDYPETDLSVIRDLLPTAGEYTVVMLDGIVLRLDGQGNVWWHRYYPHTQINNGLALPDGGYVLTGEINEEGSDGWILCADGEGNTAWEKKENDFTHCGRAVVSPEGNLLVNCYAECDDPNESGNVIAALDLQGNYLWKQKFVEKDDGVVYSIQPRYDGTTDVYLRGEGERRYTLDHEGNIISEEVLPPGPDSFSHETAPDLTFDTKKCAVGKTELYVHSRDGTETVLVIRHPMDLENLFKITSVNPTSDGGYLVASTAE
ncbi:hypothetical protein [Methanogenium organophilum]|uniref:Uncharacterized protein n=1 Tax=Methanogenium organophilum TaxID=2199 RepID=A0A9X9S3W0_METOG|nr:hypothetical protein [Methanogenium organophilum]WAI01071.1 hypothetical protein OU421_11715 [Methanogenium organophilum]